MPTEKSEKPEKSEETGKPERMVREKFSARGESGISAGYREDEKIKKDKESTKLRKYKKPNKKNRNRENE